VSPDGITPRESKREQEEIDIITGKGKKKKTPQGEIKKEKRKKEKKKKQTNTKNHWKLVIWQNNMRAISYTSIYPYLSIYIFLCLYIYIYIINVYTLRHRVCAASLIYIPLQRYY
jgi:hypothetical protein